MATVRLILSFAILLLLLSGGLATPAWASVIVDEFNDDTLDPAWNVEFTDDGGGWTFEETGGQLIVTDVVDTGDDNGVWGRVRLTQDVASLITGSFTFETAFSWDSENSSTAMQSVLVGLYDDSGSNVLIAMHYDAWFDWTGGPYAATPDGETFPGNSVAPIAGTSIVTMRRVGSDVFIDFENGIGHVGEYDGAIGGVFIEFSYFNSIVRGQSLFGTESVDYVRLVPEPSSLALLVLGGLGLMVLRRFPQT